MDEQKVYDAEPQRREADSCSIYPGSEGKALWLDCKCGRTTCSPAAPWTRVKPWNKGKRWERGQGL
eukprot:353714-Chlamydomonas_euryale.AAC.1